MLSGSREGVVGDVGGGVERVAHAVGLVPPVVDRPVVGDAEQPRAQRRQRRQLGQLVVGTGQGVLNDVFAVGDRTGHARAVAVQFGAHVVDQRQKLPATLLQHADEVVRRSATGSFASPAEEAIGSDLRQFHPAPAAFGNAP